MWTSCRWLLFYISFHGHPWFSTLYPFIPNCSSIISLNFILHLLILCVLIHPSVGRWVRSVPIREHPARSTLWIPRTELRLPFLVAVTCTHWTISPAPNIPDFNHALICWWESKEYFNGHAGTQIRMCFPGYKCETELDFYCFDCLKDWFFFF